MQCCMKSCMPIKLFLGCELHLFFGATLLSNCQLPLHYNQALYVRVWCLSALLSDSMLQKMTMAEAIYQPLCHCYATVISLCCLSTELTLTLIFSYKNLPFQTLVRWRLLYYQQLFPWLFDTLRKSSIKYLHYFYTTI